MPCLGLTIVVRRFLVSFSLTATSAGRWHFLRGTDDSLGAGLNTSRSASCTTAVVKPSPQVTGDTLVPSPASPCLTEVDRRRSKSQCKIGVTAQLGSGHREDSVDGEIVENASKFLACLSALHDEEHGSGQPAHAYAGCSLKGGQFVLRGLSGRKINVHDLVRMYSNEMEAWTRLAPEDLCDFGVVEGAASEDTFTNGTSNYYSIVSRPFISDPASLESNNEGSERGRALGKNLTCITGAGAWSQMTIREEAAQENSSDFCYSFRELIQHLAGMRLKVIKRAQILHSGECDCVNSSHSISSLIVMSKVDRKRLKVELGWTDRGEIEGIGIEGEGSRRNETGIGNIPTGCPSVVHGQARL
ncbi:hypothetical protein F5148DRAFT_1368571 [Russula earlei]|uniref:Uncharacterized protein n=1 Tax=Russula earlei TaxID=71964 RepID=A0ACC0U6A9_9AGAM|nr:hypothetical protein F5148DRAFT_1368571 [Russula earlei]